MTTPATESSPNEHFPLRWQWSIGEYKLFCLKSQDRTSFTCTKKLRMAIWHTFSTQSPSAGLRALSSWSNTEILMSFLEDSTTGKLVIYRQWVAFSLGGRAQNRVLDHKLRTGRGRHLVYSTRLAGEIYETHCCLEQPGSFTGKTHCTPCLEFCCSFFIWELLNVFLLSWMISKKWGGGVHSSYLSI